MDNINLELIDNLISNIQKNSKIYKFKYNKEFFRLWRRRLIESLDSEIVYLSNKDENTQIYHYEGLFYDINLQFDVNIQYLIDMLDLNLKDNGNLFPKIVLINDNGNLSYFSKPCKYSQYDIKEVNYNYSDMNRVLMMPLPIEPEELVIVDGNHRVCKQIYEKKTEINAYYVLDDVVIMSLALPIQVCLYSFLFDVAKIQHNLGKIKDGQIRNALNIYNPNSAFFRTINRKNINLSI